MKMYFKVLVEKGGMVCHTLPDCGYHRMNVVIL